MNRYRVIAAPITLIVLLVILSVLLAPLTVMANSPTIRALPTTYISEGEAIVHLDVIATGNWAIREWGIEYGTTTGVYTDEVIVQGELGIVSKQVALGPLESETTYYYRAKARNQDGWGYSRELSFTTMRANECRQEWKVAEDVWVGRDQEFNWYFKTEAPVIYVGYSCSVDVACGGGFRFEGIGVPENAVVEEAYLVFLADGSQEGTPKTRISVSVEGRGFTDAEDYFARERADTILYWDNVEMFNDGGWYKSPDIASIVQEAAGRDSFVLFWDDHEDRSVKGMPNQRVVWSEETRLEARWSVSSGLPITPDENESGNGRLYVWLGVGGAAIAIGVAVPIIRRRKTQTGG